MEIEKIRRPNKNQNQIRFPLVQKKQPEPQTESLPSRMITFHRGSSPVKRRWKLMAWSLAAGLIDLLMIFSVSCFVLGVLVLLMGWKVSLTQVIHTQSLQLALALTWFGFYASYLLVLRVFLGCTLGEWSCGLRLGEPRHLLSPNYSLRVHLRLVISLATGVIILPVLSLLFGVDIAGKLSGLPLVSHSVK